MSFFVLRKLNCAKVWECQNLHFVEFYLGDTFFQLEVHQWTPNMPKEMEKLPKFKFWKKINFWRKYGKKCHFWFLIFNYDCVHNRKFTIYRWNVDNHSGNCHKKIQINCSVFAKVTSNLLYYIIYNYITSSLI